MEEKRYRVLVLLLADALAKDFPFIIISQEANSPGGVDIVWCTEPCAIRPLLLLLTEFVHRLKKIYSFC